MHRQYIRTVPGSRTVVLFIHGIFGTPNHFRFFMSEVPEDYSVFNVLLDGHGGGAEDIAKTSMAKWKSQVGGIMDSLCAQFERIFIVAHSMGTLFAVDESIKHADKVAGLFLLASPLKIFLKPRSFTTTFRLVFKIGCDTPFMINAKESHGVEHTKRLWVYARWLPRYFELFHEIKQTRAKITAVSVPCTVYQSAKDEMVSKRACGYIEKNPRICLSILENSYHFYYDEADKSLLKREFGKFIAKNY